MRETLSLVSPRTAAADLPTPLNPGQPYRVVMVCTGNICRSAMAEVVLTDRLATARVPQDGPHGVAVTSGGISDEETGNPIDRRARRLLTERGYGQGTDDAARAVAERITAHHAHRVSDTELQQADLVLAMTAQHLCELWRRAERLGVDASRLRMYRELDPEAAKAREAAQSAGRYLLDVPDPWYGTMEDFEETLEVVECVSDTLAPALAELAIQRD